MVRAKYWVCLCPLHAPFLSQAHRFVTHSCKSFALKRLCCSNKYFLLSQQGNWGLDIILLFCVVSQGISMSAGFLRSTILASSPSH